MPKYVTEKKRIKQKMKVQPSASACPSHLGEGSTKPPGQPSPLGSEVTEPRMSLAQKARKGCR